MEGGKQCQRRRRRERAGIKVGVGGWGVRGGKRRGQKKKMGQKAAARGEGDLRRIAGLGSRIQL